MALQSVLDASRERGQHLGTLIFNQNNHLTHTRVAEVHVPQRVIILKLSQEEQLGDLPSGSDFRATYLTSGVGPHGLSTVGCAQFVHYLRQANRS